MEPLEKLFPSEWSSVPHPTPTCSIVRMGGAEVMQTCARKMVPSINRCMVNTFLVNTFYVPSSISSLCLLSAAKLCVGAGDAKMSTIDFLLPTGLSEWGDRQENRYSPYGCHKCKNKSAHGSQFSTGMFLQ